jgi:hypothetical protein
VCEPGSGKVLSILQFERMLVLGVRRAVSSTTRQLNTL